MALSMGYGLVQEQRMKLMMTPELHQAIQILQFSAFDLIHYIQEQVMENPVLEMEGVERGQQERGEDPLIPVEGWLDWADYSGHHDIGKKSVAESEDKGSFDWFSIPRVSLTDVLEDQLRELSLDDIKRRICFFLIGNLDEKGYLNVDFTHVCKRFNVPKDKVEQSLQVIQSLDPPGIGARSLEECLRLQLLRMKECDPIVLQVVDSFLPEIAAGRYKQVAKELGCDVARIQEAVDKIKTLNPKPGITYTVESPRYVQPDVIVEKINGEYRIVINDNYIPRLFIRRDYEQILQRRDEAGRQAASFLKSRFQSALWLMRSIEQRRDTLYRVSHAIVQEQHAFFDNGIASLKPLTLREIAERLNVHESTVSRATQNKYMQTPHGLYPFRFFFPSGVSTRFGNNASAKSVKNYIQQIIDGEDKRKPLSDQRIANLLHAKGVRISRRTVAKYREEMGIGSSSQRRRYDEVDV